MSARETRAAQLHGKKRKKPGNLVSRLDRQLLLYEIFYYCEEVCFEEITNRIPMEKRMLQRDIEDLTDAGLISVRYSRQRQAYIEDWKPEEAKEKLRKKTVTQRRQAHLNTLYRIATLMFELEHEEVSRWKQMERGMYKSCKDHYFELFPEATLPMMYRDFAELNRIGYGIEYIPEIDFYVMWEDERYLREDFGIRQRDGLLYFEEYAAKEWEALWTNWEELANLDNEEWEW